MIIIKISGGLGNQLFQYAFARALEENRGIKVKIDISSFFTTTKTITPRDYTLSRFNTRSEIADKDDFHSIGIPFPGARGLREDIFRIAFRLREYSRTRSRRKIIIDHRLNFNQDVLGSPDNSFISGVWTSEKFFGNIKDKIRDELTLKNQPTEAAKNIEKLITDSDSVSIHFRRGDYLRYSHKFAQLSDGYYHKAIDLMNKEGDKQFFIFSDDIESIKQEYGRIIGKNAFFVSGRGLTDTDELWLMSRCKHNIIANSTFSWWGAWLNRNPEKMVIAPEKYRNDGKDMSDVFPPDWIII